MNWERRGKSGRHVSGPVHSHFKPDVLEFSTSIDRLTLLSPALPGLRSGSWVAPGTRYPGMCAIRTVSVNPKSDGKIAFSVKYCSRSCR